MASGHDEDVSLSNMAIVIGYRDALSFECFSAPMVLSKCGGCVLLHPKHYYNKGIAPAERERERERGSSQRQRRTISEKLGLPYGGPARRRTARPEAASSFLK